MKINVDRDESKREKYVYSRQAVTFWLLSSKAATRGVLQKKVFLEICAACNFIKQEALAQVFSCEFCKISKNTFFTEHLWKTASVLCWLKNVISFHDLTALLK